MASSEPWRCCRDERISGIDWDWRLYFMGIATLGSLGWSHLPLLHFLEHLQGVRSLVALVGFGVVGGSGIYTFMRGGGGGCFRNSSEVARAGGGGAEVYVLKYIQMKKWVSNKDVIRDLDLEIQKLAGKLCRSWVPFWCYFLLTEHGVTDAFISSECLTQYKLLYRTWLWALVVGILWHDNFDLNLCVNPIDFACTKNCTYWKAIRSQLLRKVEKLVCRHVEPFVQMYVFGCSCFSFDNWKGVERVIFITVVPLWDVPFCLVFLLLWVNTLLMKPLNKKSKSVPQVQVSQNGNAFICM